MPQSSDDREAIALSALDILSGGHEIEGLFDGLLRPFFVGAGRATAARPSASFTGSGGKSDLVYFIQRGRFKVQQTLKDGKCHIVGFAGPGDLFGNPFSSIRHDCALVALEEGQLLAARRGPFVEAVARDPALLSTLLLAMADEIRFRVNHSAPLGRWTAEERIATFLLEEYYSQPARNGAVRLPVAMSRRDIADYVGLTIETVSRSLSQFKRAGLINLSNSQTVEILDLDSLTSLAGADVVRGKHSRIYF